MSQRRGSGSAQRKAGRSQPAGSSGGTSGSKANGNEVRKMVGQYMLGKTIGEGTFGKVKLAVHLPTGEKVAVKILEKSRIKEQADVRRVNREIKILKRSRHANIVQLYEVLDTQNSIYLMMENCEGGELFDYIVNARHVPEPQACKFFHQIINGVEALHINDVTHRDMKPENLLLKAHRDGWILKIVDFGLSNTHEGGKLLATACGSPCYAAPEMIAGKKYVGPLADMWSIGVILFALVCGFLPFEDQNTTVLYKKILSGDYKPAKWISDDVKDLISKILCTDPTKRYTVADVKAHKWYNIINESDVPREEGNQFKGLADGDEVTDEVFSYLQDAGYDVEKVKASIQSKACNAGTAMYYLLEQKYRMAHKKQAEAAAKGQKVVIDNKKQQQLAAAAAAAAAAVAQASVETPTRSQEASPAPSALQGSAPVPNSATAISATRGTSVSPALPGTTATQPTKGRSQESKDKLVQQELDALQRKAAENKASADKRLTEQQNALRVQQQQRAEQRKEQQQARARQREAAAAKTQNNVPPYLQKPQDKARGIPKKSGGRAAGAGGRAAGAVVAGKSGIGAMGLVPADLQPASQEAQPTLQQAQGDSVASGGRLVVPKLALNSLPGVQGTAAQVQEQAQGAPILTSQTARPDGATETEHSGEAIVSGPGQIQSARAALPQDVPVMDFADMMLGGLGLGGAGSPGNHGVDVGSLPVIGPPAELAINALDMQKNDPTTDADGRPGTRRSRARRGRSGNGDVAPLSSNVPSGEGAMHMEESQREGTYESGPVPTSQLRTVPDSFVPAQTPQAAGRPTDGAAPPIDTNMASGAVDGSAVNRPIPSLGGVTGSVPSPTAASINNQHENNSPTSQVGFNPLLRHAGAVSNASAVNPLTGAVWPGSGANNSPSEGVNSVASPIKVVMPAGQAPSRAAPGARPGGRARRNIVK